MKQPTILLKTRDKDDSRSVSPKRQSKDGKESVPPITIATPSSENKQGDFKSQNSILNIYIFLIITENTLH